MNKVWYITRRWSPLEFFVQKIFLLAIRGCNTYRDSRPAPLALSYKLVSLLLQKSTCASVAYIFHRRLNSLPPSKTMRWQTKNEVNWQHNGLRQAVKLNSWNRRTTEIAERGNSKSNAVVQGRRTENVNYLKYVWNILLKNDFFRFPKVKWLQYTGEVGKCTSYWCQIFSGFNTPKSLKSLNFWVSYLKNKRWTFLGHSVYTTELT